MIRNRIDDTFAEMQDQYLLSIFYTAGWPKLDMTLPLARAIQSGGGDMIEIGMPFSDPIADGPTIQACSQEALQNGMNIQLLFDQLIELRNDITIPVLLMGYINPVMQFGFEKFCAMAQTCGIDGLIIPDLPASIFIEKYKDLTDLYGLHFIQLITPLTSDSRIHYLDQAGSGFLYTVSSASTTGNTKDLSASKAYFERLKKLPLTNPIVAGFNIASYEDLSFVNQYTSGGIVGSAFIKAIKSTDDTLKVAESFVRRLKKGA